MPNLPPISGPPLLTDRAALLRHRARSDRSALFLHDAVAADAQERLGEVNKSFTAPAIVTPFPDRWAAALPRAVTVPDDDRLALAPGAHDLVVHALALHWANDPVGQLVQCRRALVPDGLFLGYLFGGQTLSDLRACLGQAEAEVTSGLSPRIVPMAEIRDTGGLLQRAGFALPVADALTIEVRYRDAFHLMRDLRAMGEGNALAARLRRPTRRLIMTRAAQLYAETCGDGGGDVTARFEIICLTGWAAHDSQQKPLRPGSAVQRLADALNADDTPVPRADPRS